MSNTNNADCNYQLLPATKLIHTARNSKDYAGCVNNPLFATSTIVFDSFESFIKADNDKEISPNKIYYGRYGSKTNTDCQELIAKIYDSDFAKITSNGHSANVIAILAFVKSGDEILINDNAYYPTRHLAKELDERFGIKAKIYNPFNIDSIKAMVSDKTKVVFVENPGSLTFETCDIQEISKAVKAKNPQIKVIADNTFATPLHHNPLKFGADVAVDSATKFFLGLSEYMCGSLAYNKQDALAIEQSFRLLAPMASPVAAHACLKGLRSLGARLKAHTDTFNYVVPELKKHPKVQQIIHPSISCTMGHENYKKYFSGAASVFSLSLKRLYSDAELAKFFNSLKFFGLGYSYGGYESLAIPFPKSLQSIRTCGMPAFTNTSNIRIYLGLEDKQDLLNDLLNALNNGLTD